MYIYELPHTERRNLCRILDQNRKWYDLGCIHMKYDRLSMQELRREENRGNSPTDELLTLWGNQNHTVLELYILLFRMNHFQAMSQLKNFVDSQYYHLMKEETTGESKEMLKQMLKLGNSRHIPEEVKILNNNQQQLLVPVIQIEVGGSSRENNESVKPRSPNPPDRASSSRISSISSVAESAGAIPQITYDELQKATNNWDPQSILGKGGFGTVYKGTWKCTEVAIKRIKVRNNNAESNEEEIKQSITELHCLNAYRHDNVLSVYGFSSNGPQPCLVYQYMQGGCLERRLRNKTSQKELNWVTRMDIAIGTARGLQFLHTIGDKPLVHGDIKSANILLDVNNNARIGDFGLAREGPNSKYTHITVNRIQGTRPYLPDEFLRAKQFSPKVDTYSFGVVLFELATGLPAYSVIHHNNHNNNANVVPIVNNNNNRPAVLPQQPQQQQQPPVAAARQSTGRFLRDHVLNTPPAQRWHLLHDKSVTVVGNGSTGANDYDRYHCEELLRIGVLCVAQRACDRPEMVTVLGDLEKTSKQKV